MQSGAIHQCLTGRCKGRPCLRALPPRLAPVHNSHGRRRTLALDPKSRPRSTEPGSSGIMGHSSSSFATS